MRFDDSLDTVLAADMSGPAGVEWTWRQLVDLIGRGRSGARADAIERLQAIRDQVARPVRLAAARGLERANPPAELVALFIDDELPIAGPVVRSAQLSGEEWIRLLPAMRPATRGVLRLRGDLPVAVTGALAAFGPTDFALHGEAGKPMTAAIAAPAPVSPPTAPLGTSPPDLPPVAANEPMRFVSPVTDAFVRIGDVARAFPFVADMTGLEAIISRPASLSREDMDIPSLVARIKAHEQATGNLAPPPLAPPHIERRTGPRTTFRFETDAAGLIRWVDGVERTPLIGLSLTAGRDGRPAQVDGVAAGALAHRGRFNNARLEVGGVSEAAGSWRISAAPVFDHASGRFTGYRGTARRPRADEAPRAIGAAPTTDALRQLVHELRTPANAISGFAEMIEREILGPVADAYREQAATIRGQTVGLLDAIEDLDTAARLEARRLDLRQETVELAPLVARIQEEIAPLTQLRGTRLALTVEDAVAVGDAAAIDRLLSRFLTALAASARDGEDIVGRMVRDGDTVMLSVSRPTGFVAPHGALFEADAETEAATEGGPLLGTGFGFRLARRLAVELGGSLVVEPEALTLRLPAALERSVEQATN